MFRWPLRHSQLLWPWPGTCREGPQDTRTDSSHGPKTLEQTLAMGPKALEQTLAMAPKVAVAMGAKAVDMVSKD